LQPAFDILLVEDNPADAEITLEAFRRSSNHRVHVTRDGEEAMDFLLRRGRFARAGNAPRPDLVLLDLNLPKKSGYEVLTELRANVEIRHVPVIILSTSDREEDVVRCYRLGANNYLTKPVQFEECVRLIALIQRYWLEISKLPPKRTGTP
jgi:two-component system, chemotaxis family, response regulator Rcp1